MHCALEESYVHVSVQDHGVGIPPEQIDQIFIPYNRIHSATTQYIQGTRLGLPIVRQIVEMHAGKVWVESVPDHGSCFHFILPLHLPDNTSTADETCPILEHGGMASAGHGGFDQSRAR